MMSGCGSASPAERDARRAKPCQLILQCVGVRFAVVTIDISPTIDIGPLALAWHGLMIAVRDPYPGIGRGQLPARARAVD